MKKIKEYTISLIRKVERIVRTDILYVIKGISWLGINQIVTSVIVFLLSLVFTNLLAPEIYGLYKFILSIGAILAIPTLNGIDAAVSQAVARKFEGAMVLGLKVKLRYGILSVLGGIVLGIYYYTHGNHILAFSFAIMGLAVCLSEAFDIYNSLLSGRTEYKTYTYYNILTQLFLAVGLTLTIYSTQNLIILVAVYALLHTVVNLVFLIATIKRQKPNNSVDPETIKYGKHLSVVGIITTVIEQLDKILVFHYLGTVDLAIYAVAMAPAEQIRGALKNIQFLALPKFAANTKENVQRTIFHKAFYLGLFTAVIALIYIILAPFFFKFFFPKYLASIIYSQIYAIGLIGASSGALFYTFLEAHSAKKQIYAFNITTNILNIIILFPLIYYFGIMGAIVARVLSKFIALGTGANLVKKF